MPRRYLFGPLSPGFADQCLSRQRQAGSCITFGRAGVDLPLDLAESWDTVSLRLPLGWQPDFLALYLPYTTLPAWVCSTPLPLIGLAPDWNLLWHHYRQLLPKMDLVLTDSPGVEVMARAGFTNARPANLFGPERSLLEHAWPDSPRDIDILFIGNLHPVVQRERLPWLARLANLQERWRVCIKTGIFGDEYRQLLGRAKIVFNRSLRGEANKRVFEAAAAGALLFQEEGNLEVQGIFTDRQECVYYNADNLERLLEYYLVHEEERQAIAQAARAKVSQYSFENLWQQHLKLIEQEWPGIQERCTQRLIQAESHCRGGAGGGDTLGRTTGAAAVVPEKLAVGFGEGVCHAFAAPQALGDSPDRGRAAKACHPGFENNTPFIALLGRAHEATAANDGLDPRLWPDLVTALQTQPTSASLHHALGLAVGLAGQVQGLTWAGVAEQAAGHFQRALACDPHHVLAGLNLVEALEGIQQRPAALQQAQRLLALLDRQPHLDAEVLDASHFPPGFDPFRVEWERAAWHHAGDPAAEAQAKIELIRWRLHCILARVLQEHGLAQAKTAGTANGHPGASLGTDAVIHHYEAVAARPDLPTSQAALGQALTLTGKPGPARVHLQQAVAANPFDLDAVRTYAQLLQNSGDLDAFRRLARDRRRLSFAAPQLVPAEEWFIPAVPIGDELVSIVILCCNQLDYTRQCLDSVLQHTRAPYELVLVDNGSHDGTLAFLEEIRSRPGPERVIVLHNDRNVGFPAGCNQAVTRASGPYVVFLNNDTVVTPGWLEGLIGWALHDFPKVGLVGAVTNHSRPPQQIPVDYTALDGLEQFATQRRREFAGKSQSVDRLTGFCLLARRNVFDEVGGFDERFELGFFDDDDLCVKVRRAGHHLLVALNVFIHHYGNRTFQGLGLDSEQQLRQNFQRFQAKWGAQESKGYRLPNGAPAASLPARARENVELPTPGSGLLPATSLVSPDVIAGPSLVELAQGGGSGLLPATSATSLVEAAGWLPPSLERTTLCIITKNEEANIGPCLESVKDLVPQIIVADTGSTDRTKEIAASYGAKVIEFAWVERFAAARNECLRHATGDWILWIDADDRLDEANRQLLGQLLPSLPPEIMAVVMKCQCLADPKTGSVTNVDHVRLFRNHPDLRWSYRVHEQILPAVRRLGGSVYHAEVVIQHTGYLDPALRGRKSDRDLHLLQIAVAEHPEDPYVQFNLGWNLYGRGWPKVALTYLQRSLQRSHKSDSIVRKLHALIVSCLKLMGKPQEALRACHAGRNDYPQDEELLFEEGKLRLELDDEAGAERCWLELLHGSREGAHFASVEQGLRGYLTREKLAGLYQQQRRYAEAEALWQAVLAEHPEHGPAWFGLAEAWLSLGQEAEAEQLTLQVESQQPDGPWAPAMRSSWHLTRKEYPAARALLETAVKTIPRVVLLWRLLGRTAWQQGDWPAAERAWRQVLALEAGDREARHYLQLLLTQRQQTNGARH